MLSLSARRLAQVSRGSAATRIALRPSSSISLDKSQTQTEIEGLQPLEPTEWFPEFTDPAIRSQLLKLREIESELIAKVSTKGEPMDWAHWEKTVKSPGLVQELKKIHETTPIPDVEAEKAILTKNIDEVFDPIIAEFTQLAKDAEEETAKLEARAADVKYLRDNIRELTVEQFLEKYPKVKASIADDIANNRWFIRD